MSRPFQFKSFAINQDHAPMKVGTDGVLLGAWCTCHNISTALDIGTGTGLIALMLAQRSANISITAIEPNADAFADAKINFEASPWNTRIRLMQTTLAHFPSTHKFDLLVSNPPFFHSGIVATEKGRQMARHVEGFDYLAFLDASKHLTKNGILAGIYPTEIFDLLLAKAENFGLYLHRKCEIKPTPSKAPHRVLFEFSFKEKSTPISESLVIESNGRHQYSDTYKELTKDFYLKF